MFLKNKNIIFKIRRSKVTDYAALILAISCMHVNAIMVACKNNYVSEFTC